MGDVALSTDCKWYVGVGSATEESDYSKACFVAESALVTKVVRILQPISGTHNGGNPQVLFDKTRRLCHRNFAGEASPRKREERSSSLCCGTKSCRQIPNKIGRNAVR